MNDRAREMIAAVEDDPDRDGIPSRVAAPTQPAQVYSVRIPVDRLEQLRLLAAKREIAPSRLIRDLVIRELDRDRAEGDRASESERSAPLRIRRTATTSLPTVRRAKFLEAV